MLSELRLCACRQLGGVSAVTTLCAGTATASSRSLVLLDMRGCGLQPTDVHECVSLLQRAIDPAFAADGNASECFFVLR